MVDKATLIVFSTLLIVFGVIFAALFAMLIPLLNAERQHWDQQQREEDCNDMMLGDRLWNRGYVFAVAKHCFEFFNFSFGR